MATFVSVITMLLHITQGVLNNYHVEIDPLFFLQFMWNWNEKKCLFTNKKTFYFLNEPFLGVVISFAARCKQFNAKVKKLYVARIESFSLCPQFAAIVSGCYRLFYKSLPGIQRKYM